MVSHKAFVEGNAYINEIVSGDGFDVHCQAWDYLNEGAEKGHIVEIGASIIKARAAKEAIKRMETKLEENEASALWIEEGATPERRDNRQRLVTELLGGRSNEAFIKGACLANEIIESVLPPASSGSPVPPCKPPNGSIKLGEVKGQDLCPFCREELVHEDSWWCEHFSRRSHRECIGELGSDECFCSANARIGLGLEPRLPKPLEEPDPLRPRKIKEESKGVPRVKTRKTRPLVPGCLRSWEEDEVLKPFPPKAPPLEPEIQRISEGGLSDEMFSGLSGYGFLIVLGILFIIMLVFDFIKGLYSS